MILVKSHRPHAKKEARQTIYLFFYYWRSVGHAGGEKQDDSSDFALDCTADG
jgi:hypothetical protein